MVDKGRLVPRQLDLHPRPVREGRPRAELPFLVARNGAARHDLPGARIFLLRGRRPVGRARRRADRARPAGRSSRSVSWETARCSTAAWCGMAKAYPVYDDDYRHNVAMIRLELERDYPTLHMVGRNGMHKYNNQDHAMMTAHAGGPATSWPASAATTSGRSTKTPNITKPAPPAPVRRSRANAPCRNVSRQIRARPDVEPAGHRRAADRTPRSGGIFARPSPNVAALI